MSIICMFGPPNAGKGTYGQRLAVLLGVPYFACGNLLREKLATDEAWFEGRYTKAMQDAGDLCPTDLANRIVFEAIAGSSGGCVLDGFPREGGQVEPFFEMIGDGELCLVNITHPMELLVARSINRRVCCGCGRSYAVGNVYMEPPADGRCVACGGEVVRRGDDDLEVMRHRIEVYHRQTEPILSALCDRCDVYVSFSPQGDDVDELVAMLKWYIDVARDEGFHHLMDGTGQVMIKREFIPQHGEY